MAVLSGMSGIVRHRDRKVPVRPGDLNVFYDQAHIGFVIDAEAESGLNSPDARRISGTVRTFSPLSAVAIRHTPALRTPRPRERRTVLDQPAHLAFQSFRLAPKFFDLFAKCIRARAHRAAPLDRPSFLVPARESHIQSHYG